MGGLETPTGGQEFNAGGLLGGVAVIVQWRRTATRIKAHRAVISPANEFVQLAVSRDRGNRRAEFRMNSSSEET
jgi:hypothetical protein